MDKPSHTPDPAESASGGGSSPGAGPAAARVAKAGARAKLPAQVDIEKALSRLEDNHAQLDAKVSGLTEWLDQLFPGGKAPSPKASTVSGAAPRKGFWDEIEEDLGMG